MQQAGVAAGNVFNFLTASSAAPKPFAYLPLGEMLTLGLADGAISSLGGLLQLSGPLAGMT